MKLGSRCIVQTSRPNSNLGVIAPWVRIPKMWRWARTLGKSAQGVQRYVCVCVCVTAVDCGSPPAVMNASLGTLALGTLVRTTYLSDVIGLSLTWVTSRLPVYLVISFIVMSFTRLSPVTQMDCGHRQTSNRASVSHLLTLSYYFTILLSVNSSL